ncbi:MAG: SDR family oxidoreductase [Myxococcales bacterium]|nr:SDR family oxidoreductase [Myxococcales bacterium]
MSYFRGKRVLLVGGSEGIGEAAAVALTSQGAHVVIAARRQGPLDDCLGRMRAMASDGQRLAAVSMDVTDRARVRASVAEVSDALGGGVDVLITNVGMARPGYILDLTDDDFDRMMDVNFMGHANVVRAYLPTLLEQPTSDVCFVSSALGFMSSPGYSAYSATKFAVAGFAESLRVELADRGVRVTLFYPGTTDTPGLEKENETKPAAVWKLESESSFNKVRSPDDVAVSLLRSIQRGRFENFPGFEVWLQWFAFKRFPGLSRGIMASEWRTALKKTAAEVASEGGSGGT